MSSAFSDKQSIISHTSPFSIAPQSTVSAKPATIQKSESREKSTS